jgi:uncharacterized protein YecT (DUF1311 family)
MAAIICSHAAHADDIYDKCIEASNDSNQAWARCGNEYVQREKKKLDDTWAKLIREQEGRTKADLLKEQQAWQRFSQAACEFYANGDLGREGQVLNYPVCKARLYADRARTLQAYQDDP